MKQYTGFIIISTFVFYLLSIVMPSVSTIPVVLAWIVPLLTWHKLGKNGVQQCSFLLLTGIVTICFAASKGVFLGWKQIFAVNVPLISMFVAVTFPSEP
jgi:hypothetical protein